MPIYHFNIWRGRVPVLDIQGQHLADDEAAHAFGVEECRSLADQDLGGDLRQWRVEVLRQGDEKPLAVLPLDECE